MNRITEILFAAALLAPILPAAAESPEIPQDERDYVLRNLAAEKLNAVKLKVPAAELKARGGLPNFFRKAEAGEPVRVAYFGGSIAAHNGWRPQTFDYLKKKYPAAKLNMLNASLGGTGSIFGVFRADKDLLPFKPDLVFVEFAVNDSGDAQRRTEDVIRAMEGIVRKLRLQNPEVDICFVYTMQESSVKPVREGVCYPAVAVHEQVAAYYDLPSIYVAPEVVRMIDAGDAVFKGKVADKATGRDTAGKFVITEDATHPVIPTGHALYAKIVNRSIDSLAAEKRDFSARTLSKPMRNVSWEKAKTIPVHGNATLSGSWRKLDKNQGPADRNQGKRIYNNFPYMYRTTEPGASITVRFNGSIVGLKTISGPDSGVIDITVDGKPLKKENQFTVYSHMISYTGSPLPEMAEGVHTATWTLLPEKPDKGKILASYYRPGNDRDFKQNPQRYADCALSAGEIMLVGEIIKPEGDPSK